MESVINTTPRKTAMKKKKVRYIAVDTERSAKSSPKAKKTIMVYDTETNKVASNVASDIARHLVRLGVVNHYRLFRLW